MIPILLAAFFGCSLMFFAAWLDLTGRAKKPVLFFALGVLSLAPLMITIAVLAK